MNKALADYRVYYNL